MKEEKKRYEIKSSQVWKIGNERFCVLCFPQCLVHPNNYQSTSGSFQGWASDHDGRPRFSHGLTLLLLIGFRCVTHSWRDPLSPLRFLSPPRCSSFLLHLIGGGWPFRSFTIIPFRLTKVFTWSQKNWKIDRRHLW